VALDCCCEDFVAFTVGDIREVCALKVHQGTSLPQLLQTSQDQKLAWLAQIRLAQFAYAFTQDGDESTDIDSETLETTQDP
jgi:hypothetical protein